jgi:hypothetical protein
MEYNTLNYWVFGLCPLPFILKTMYTGNLLLNAVIAGTEALVVWRNKFCMYVSKNYATCELSHVLTPLINSWLLLKLYNLNQFFR